MASGAPGLVQYISRSYGYERICYGLPVDGARFAYARTLPVRRIARNSSYWNATRVFVPPARGLVHSFNELVVGARAWVVSHELELPRFLRKTKPQHLRAAYAKLAGDACRAILPMSDAARAWMLRHAPDACRDALARKAQVFTGGVKGPEHLGISQQSATREPNEPLKLVFVGNNSFRKGGPYVLDAFDRLRAEGVNVELTFIGNVDAHSYVVPVTAGMHADFVRRLQETSGVTWVRHATNRDVLSTMVSSHVGLLPTLDDSLGWSVIEMMAAGLPVIASNIVALPEIIADGVTGQLIELPRDADRRWVGVTTSRGDAHTAANAHDLLVTGLTEAIAALHGDEDLRLRWGSAGRLRYEQQYTPELAAAQLAGIYEHVAG